MAVCHAERRDASRRLTGLETLSVLRETTCTVYPEVVSDVVPLSASRVTVRNLIPPMAYGLLAGGRHRCCAPTVT
jgi:hypothetical protein